MSVDKYKAEALAEYEAELKRDNELLEESRTWGTGTKILGQFNKLFLWMRRASFFHDYMYHARKIGLMPDEHTSKRVDRMWYEIANMDAGRNVLKRGINKVGYRIVRAYGKREWPPHPENVPTTQAGSSAQVLIPLSTHTTPHTPDNEQ